MVYYLMRYPKFILNFCILFVLLLAGCSEQEGIQTRKEVRIQPPKTRILGAILPIGDSEWYFKVMGSTTDLQAHAAEFDQFIRSIQLGEGKSEPTWIVPDEWKQAANNQFSKAAFYLDGKSQQPRLKLTVSQVSGGIIANLNRWRGQIGLSKISESELGESTEEILLANGKKILKFDQIGTPNESKMMPPMMGGK